MESERDKREHLISLFEDVETVMLVTRSMDGQLRGRPMGLAEVQPDGTIYFNTSMDSGKVPEIAANPEVAVVLQQKTRWASISGHAEVVKDAQLVDRLWRESWRVWFPEGKNDPHLCLIHLEPTSGEYWDSSGSKGITFVIEAARAYLGGREYDASDARVNERVDL